MSHLVFWYILTDVSEMLIFSIFRVMDMEAAPVEPRPVSDYTVQHLRRQSSSNSKALMVTCFNFVNVRGSALVCR